MGNLSFLEFRLRHSTFPVFTLVLAVLYLLSASTLGPPGAVSTASRSASLFGRMYLRGCLRCAFS